MIASHLQNVVQKQNIIIGNLSIENVDKLQYLGVTVTNTNGIHEEIKRRINMGNACYYSLEKILSPFLFSKKNGILIHIKQLYYWLYCMIVKLGLSSWKRSRSLGCSRIKDLERYLELKETKLPDSGESFIILSYTHCILHIL